jgi:hypothetical protein
MQGRQMKYVGYYFKRVRPDDDSDLQTLKPGDTLRTDFDLTDGYALEPGQIFVRFRGNPFQNHLPDSNEVSEIVTPSIVEPGVFGIGHDGYVGAVRIDPEMRSATLFEDIGDVFVLATATISPKRGVFTLRGARGQTVVRVGADVVEVTPVDGLPKLLRSGAFCGAKRGGMGVPQQIVFCTWEESLKWCADTLCRLAPHPIAGCTALSNEVRLRGALDDIRARHSQ